MANERNCHDKNTNNMKPDFSIYMYIQISSKSSHESGNPWRLCTICTKTGIYIILKILKFLNNIQVIIQISSLGVLQLRSNPQTLLTNAATVPVSQGTQLYALKLSM